MRTERLATIVRRVLLAESKAERSAPRVKLLSEEGMDEELVAFVDSDIEPDSASLQSHQNFSVTSMTADDIVNSVQGVKEYNVHFAGAFIAALPTLVVYLLSGKYFVRGLMAGSVKG